MTYVALQEVSYRYDSLGDSVLHQITLEVQRGEFCCLIGRSGCGKSTLLKLAGGLLTPSDGIAQLDGRPIRTGKDIGFVFQQPTLLEWRTVLDNVLLPIMLHRKPTPEDRLRASSLLERMGLSTYMNRYPQQLSGGQQSRVALARALVTQPMLLLLDEPFAALDALTREELQAELMEWVAAERMTAIFVTHDIGEATYLGDRVITIEEGRAKRETIIPYPRPRSPQLRYEAEFQMMAKAVRQTLEETCDAI